MHTEQRAEYWENWNERLNELTNEVWEALSRKFTPPRNVQPDKDAAPVKELHRMLEAVANYINQYTAKIQEEVRRMNCAWDLFRAWEVGLCPYAMQKYVNAPNRRRNDAGDSENWEEIAGFRCEEGISYEDTLSAILAWQESKQEAV